MARTAAPRAASEGDNASNDALEGESGHTTALGDAPVENAPGATSSGEDEMEEEEEQETGVGNAAGSTELDWSTRALTTHLPKLPDWCDYIRVRLVSRRRCLC